MDFILNGQATGNVAGRLMQSGFNPTVLRPWIGKDGNTYIAVNKDGVLQAQMVHNATATLRKDDWIQLDDAIVRAAKPRLQAVADLRGAGLQYSITNGMGKTVLETESQSDISDAEISMDGTRQSKGDRPEFDLTSLPLPIIHKDFQFSARQVMASRNGGSPLDTTTAELASRRVAEQAEKLLLGTASSYAFGGGTIYGYTNFPDRLTKSDITSPEASGWTPATTLNEVLAMRQLAHDAYHYGPYFLYFSPAWDAYLDRDYSSSYPGVTLRSRLAGVFGQAETRDYLGTGYTILLVQKTADVARMVVGMEVTTVQWETMGGMMMNFKVMAILVPQLRKDFNGNTGIVHGTTS